MSHNLPMFTIKEDDEPLPTEAQLPWRSTCIKVNGIGYGISVSDRVDDDFTGGD